MSKWQDIYWPFSTKLVREWPGERDWGLGYHVGTDFGVAQGTPLRATIAGTVHLIWDDGLGAYVLDIVAPNGLVCRNAHLSRMDAKHGSWVNPGDHIGLTGGAAGALGSGYSTGPHLHWELRWNRNWTGPGWIDPRHLKVLSFDEMSKPKEEVKIEDEEDEVANHYVAKMVGSVQYNAIFNTTSGFCQEFTSNNGGYNTNIAKTFGVKDPTSLVSVSHYDAIVEDCRATREGKK